MERLFIQRLSMKELENSIFSCIDYAEFIERKPYQ